MIGFESPQDILETLILGQECHRVKVKPSEMTFGQMHLEEN